MKDILRFLRFEYLAFALLLPQIGAASAAASVTATHIAGLVAASLAFHIYISLLNDLIDLPLDRTNPGRKNYPLVKGTIKPWQAWIVTVTMIPSLIGLTVWSGGSAAAFGAMSVTVGLMTIYDVWGKKTRVPPLIDLIQGVGFGAMALFGADIAGEVNALSWLLFAWIVAWMVLANFLGGMRDLREDHRFGVCTTPILFGMKHEGERLAIPRWVPGYTYALQGAMTALALMMLLSDGLGHGTVLRAVLIAVTMVMGGVALFLLATLFGVARYDLAAMKKVGSLQLSVSLSAILVLFFGRPHGWLFASLFGLLYVPSFKFRFAWIKDHWSGSQRRT